ncbi:hypothetical protein QBC37DRAFT_16185 [Rhypophila decipiens]|uniref:ADF-H domain-containing protein n=1 Tax=Rhypophila decipiens TaxID=261697 RepID=A0AAN7BC95_9PEZI|nr:hypothetical protein QBC37DRAFT_16185 [Rhypophila decipiens]
MSLNGLDAPNVKEAYEAAVAEPGGWFLLKYASRDEVELLGRGNGGIVEVRNRIAQYEENSPLYGFLRYRRRNVIIKFQPEECSRLVQARASVHFNLICEHLSPHDTSFSITDAKDLTDTKLSAACSLHAASGSTSSSTSSLRRRRLMEITEEQEEEEERERKRQSIVKEEGYGDMPTDPPVKLDADLASAPGASNFSNSTEPPDFTGAPRAPSPTKSFDDGHRRMSSQSARHDLYSSQGLRVRLGPRPSAELGGRPRTSAGSATYRPVSSIPAGFKVSKGHKKDRSQDDISAESPILEEMSHTGEEEQADEETARPRTSSGASQMATPPSPFKLDFTVPPPTANQQKPNTVSKEKARLLKAMKLREKKMMASQAASLGAVENPSESNSPAMPPSDLEVPVPENNSEAQEAMADTNGHLENSLALSNADSGIDVDGDQLSADIPLDSHPTSPMAVSDIGDSTQASSISESTDETVLADKEPGIESTDGTMQSRIAQDDEKQRHAEGPVTEPSISDIGPAVSVEGEPQTTEDGDVTPNREVEATSGESTAADVTGNQNGKPALGDTGEGTSADRLDEQVPRPSEIRIPVSKFSTQENKSPTSSSPIHSTTSQAIPSIVIPSDDVDNEAAAEAGKRTEDGQVEVQKEAQRSETALEPTRRGLSHQGGDKRMSVASLSDDDRLMDELQSATLQEAQPIVVSKSPVSPFFPSDATLKRTSTALDSNPSTPRIVRTVSSPAQGPLLAPSDVPTGSVRSASSGSVFLQKVSQHQAAVDLKPKPGKIGSSISQRIKALQNLSGAPAAPEVAAKERPSSTFFSVRKTSIREPSRSPSLAERASSLTRKSPTPPGSLESSPEALKMPRRDRTGSMVSRLSVFEGGNVPRGRPESIQVTARIVRDASQTMPKAFEPKADPGDYTPLDLKQSPLVVDVQNTCPVLSRTSTSGLPEPESPQDKKLSLLQRRFSKGRRSESHDRVHESTKEDDSDDAVVGRPRRRSSMTIVKDFIKERRDSMLGSAKAPSTDNLGLNISSAQLNLASPASMMSSRSPSRPPSTHQTSSFSHRLSISSRRSSMEQKSPAPTPNGLSTTFSSSSTDMVGETEAKGKTGEKGTGSALSITTPGSGPTSPTTSKNSSSRASRFIRRLSTTLGSAKKTVTPSISPTVTEEDAAEVEAAGGITSRPAAGSMQTPSIVAYLGDVNVQFPDNLLWKRRAMCLDSQGFLILSAVQGTAAALTGTILAKDKHHQAGAIKRYHMSDFKSPYTPEIEVQELPNSVILDFVDGSGLQIACEDRAGQMNVLNILAEAHQSHTQFGL